jgi:Uma2 family endonuclease
MESQRHYDQMHLLTDSLNLAWQDRDDCYVAGNMAVYYSQTQAKRNDFKGPDVFVVLDTVRKERKSWVVWEEERTPDVVIELLSESTEQADRGEKKRIYAKVLKVGEYYLFDPHTGQLEGYELDLQTLTYHSVEPDERGQLPCRRLGLSLAVLRGSYRGIETDWLRWIGADGRALPHSWDLDAAASEARQRAEQEARRAEHEAERAEHEAERAEHEAERARAAEDRATEAERKLAELEAKLAKLEGRG